MLRRFRDTRRLIRRRRMMTKDGNTTIHKKPPTGLHVRLHEMWGTLMNMRWRYMLIIFAISYVINWIIFGSLWYALAGMNGDLEEYDEMPENHTFCVKNVKTFLSAFAFAIETQLTIGYGNMYPNSRCLRAIVIVVAEMLEGIILDAVLTGAFVAKFAHPKNGAIWIRFTNSAVIADVDGAPNLIFQVANTEHRPLTDVRLDAILYQEIGNEELYQTTLDFHVDGITSDECPIFIYPLTYCHPISPESPLFDFLQHEDPRYFEIVVFLSAMEDGTGEVCQRRTSYILSEIVMNHYFASVLQRDERGEYHIKMENFDKIIPGVTPIVSDEAADDLADLESPNALVPTSVNHDKAVHGSPKAQPTKHTTYNKTLPGSSKVIIPKGLFFDKAIPEHPPTGLSKSLNFDKTIPVLFDKTIPEEPNAIVSKSSNFDKAIPGSPNTVLSKSSNFENAVPEHPNAIVSKSSNFDKVIPGSPNTTVHSKSLNFEKAVWEHPNAIVAKSSNFDKAIPEHPNGIVPKSSNFDKAIPGSPSAAVSKSSNFDKTIPGSPNTVRSKSSNFEKAVPEHPNAIIPKSSNFDKVIPGSPSAAVSKSSNSDKAIPGSASAVLSKSSNFEKAVPEHPNTIVPKSLNFEKAIPGSPSAVLSKSSNFDKTVPESPSATVSKSSNFDKIIPRCPNSVVSNSSNRTA